MAKNVIYDFETLGQDPLTAPVLSLGIMEYNDKRFLSATPYTYDELLDMTKYRKFDVADQVKNHGRKIQQETLDWWKQQGEEAKKVLKPSKEDTSITELRAWIEVHYDTKGVDYTFTRGNTFDPMFLKYVCGHDVFPWWTVRDTRSYIDALLIGETELDNKFVLPEWKEKFVHHDARHDIVVDVLRMQELVRAIHYDDDIPF